jgi:hypothetical protein
MVIVTQNPAPCARVAATRSVGGRFTLTRA